LPQHKVELLQHQARTSETLRRLAVKTSVADEKGKAEQSDKPATPQLVGSGSASSSSSASSVTGTPSPGHDQDMHNSEEDDPDLRLAISLSLGRDW
jgi:hypothetical protein